MHRARNHRKTRGVRKRRGSSFPCTPSSPPSEARHSTARRAPRHTQTQIHTQTPACTTPAARTHPFSTWRKRVFHPKFTLLWGNKTKHDSKVCSVSITAPRKLPNTTQCSRAQRMTPDLPCSVKHVLSPCRAPSFWAISICRHVRRLHSASCAAGSGGHHPGVSAWPIHRQCALGPGVCVKPPRVCHRNFLSVHSPLFCVFWLCSLPAADNLFTLHVGQHSYRAEMGQCRLHNTRRQ